MPIKNAGSLSQSFGVVASFLDELNDCHTFFLPPARPFHVDYGFRLAMVGDNCFIWRVRPGTEAAEKIDPADQVLGYDSFAVNRADFWKLEYYFNALAPQKASILALRDPAGKERTVAVMPKYAKWKKCWI
jgi:hypothetical protein